MSDRTDFSESPGTLRPSQIVTTFGPGSVVQMEHDSVIVMGTDTWNTSDKYYEKINHPYLESLLDKDHFRMPRSVGKSRAISCRSFPVWGVCSNNRCHLLQRHKNAPPDGRRTFKCDECRYELLPAIFVMICEKGHLDEFPWIEWAHSEAKDSCSPNPKLRFRYRGKQSRALRLLREMRRVWGGADMRKGHVSRRAAGNSRLLQGICPLAGRWPQKNVSTRTAGPPRCTASRPARPVCTTRR